MNKELKAVSLAIASAVCGAVAKFVVGMMTGSMALISSAVDSLGDIFVSILNVFVIRISGKAADEKHNFGHQKIEGLGVMFEGGFILAAGIFLMYESVTKLFSGERPDMSLLGLYVIVPAIAWTAYVVKYLSRVAEETGSSVLKADSLHYKTDLYVNIGVLFSLVATYFTGLFQIDYVVSAIIAGYMCFASINIVKDGFGIVMMEALPNEEVVEIKAKLEQIYGTGTIHDLKTQRGRSPVIDFHVSLPGSLTNLEIHNLFLKAKSMFPDNYIVKKHTDVA